MKSLLLLRFLKPFAPLAWPLLRITVGVLLALHGWHHVSGGSLAFANDLEARGVPFPQGAAWASIVAQLGGGVLLVLGLFTRPAALAGLLTKAGSLWFAHRAALDQIGSSDSGDVELQIALGVACLALLFRGAGTLSLDGPEDSGS